MPTPSLMHPDSSNPPANKATQRPNMIPPKRARHLHNRKQGKVATSTTYVWRKRKGIARVLLTDGAIHLAEVHRYEAAGIRRKEYKIKHLL